MAELFEGMGQVGQQLFLARNDVFRFKNARLEARIFKKGEVSSLKLDGIVHHSALGAAGKVHIRIVGINVAAAFAAVDTIFTLTGLEAPSPEFSINAHSREAAQQNDHVGQHQIGDSHVKGSFLS
jgi:hypothetical protein